MNLIEYFWIFKKLYKTVGFLVYAMCTLGFVTSFAEYALASGPPKIKQDGDFYIIPGMDKTYRVPIAKFAEEAGFEDVEQYKKLTAKNWPKLIQERNQRMKALKVIKHVKGDNGVPLAYVMKPKIKSKPMPELPEVTPQMRKKIQDVVDKKQFELEKKMRSKIQKKIEKYRECTPDEHGTSKVQTGPIKNQRLAKILEKDVLFIPPRMDVLNPKTTFGKYIEVIVLEPGKLHENSLAMSLNIKCLPFRFRATKRMNFRHYGDDALKNYDDDYLGPGVFAGSYADKE